MSVELKIKAKSLAEEAKIIRKEEVRQKRLSRKKDPNGGYWHPDALGTYVKLHHHRTQPVRIAARHTHLARAFIAGTPYKSVECAPRYLPNTRDIAKMAQAYGAMGWASMDEAMLRVSDWLKA